MLGVRERIYRGLSTDQESPDKDSQILECLRPTNEGEAGDGFPVRSDLGPARARSAVGRSVRGLLGCPRNDRLSGPDGCCEVES